ncbi:unnamed protein product [Parnassius mnemosyne]
MMRRSAHLTGLDTRASSAFRDALSFAARASAVAPLDSPGISSIRAPVWVTLSRRPPLRAGVYNKLTDDDDDGDDDDNDEDDFDDDIDV